MTRSNRSVRSLSSDEQHAHRSKISWLDRYLPNARWYVPSVVVLISLSVEFGQIIWFDLYVFVGAIVSTAMMVFKNPKPDNKTRFDLAFCVVMLAMMWPVVLFAMLLEQPWNSASWKNRLEQDDTRE